MDSVAAMPSATSGIISPPMPSAVLENALDDVPAHHANAVVAFMIGLGIVTLASIMNAAGLNLTKLDHVCYVEEFCGKTLTAVFIKSYRLERVPFLKPLELKTG